MADFSQIFSFQDPQTVFPDEAPRTDGDIASRIVEGVFESANKVIQGVYGQRATIPNGGTDTRNVLGGAGGVFGNASIGGISVVTLLLIGLILFLIFRR